MGRQLKKVKAAILGVGPAGLTAAAAVLRYGGSVDLIAKDAEPSKLYGCQYLHAPIPHFTVTGPVEVDYKLNGTPGEYRRKVYGKNWDGDVSPEDLGEQHLAWDIRQTYEYLWIGIVRMNTACLQQAVISPRWMDKNFSTLRADYDLVISTVPAKSLCINDSHVFSSQKIYAAGSRKPVDQPRSDIIMCDGTTDNDWYRQASVFGYQTTEWAKRPAHTRAVSVEKPLSTDCDCFPGIVRSGRYGRWEKGVLVHETYAQVQQLLE